jgi:hypothetical protein
MDLTRQRTADFEQLIFKLTGRSGPGGATHSAELEEIVVDEAKQASLWSEVVNGLQNFRVMKMRHAVPLALDFLGNFPFR